MEFKCQKVQGLLLVNSSDDSPWKSSQYLPTIPRFLMYRFNFKVFYIATIINQKCGDLFVFFVKTEQRIDLISFTDSWSAVDWRLLFFIPGKISRSFGILIRIFIKFAPAGNRTRDPDYIVKPVAIYMWLEWSFIAQMGIETIDSFARGNFWNRKVLLDQSICTKNHKHFTLSHL